MNEVAELQVLLSVVFAAEPRREPYGSLAAVRVPTQALQVVAVPLHLHLHPLPLPFRMRLQRHLDLLAAGAAV